MEAITYIPLVVVYQVCWYCAATLIWMAAMGSPMARIAIKYYTRPL